MILSRFRKFVENPFGVMVKDLSRQVTQLNINNGKILSKLNLNYHVDSILSDIQNAEFQIFSQWGDDGIINFLVNYLHIKEKSFVEFGVENYTECNTRFLLINDNWRGLIMDGSESNMQSVRNEMLYWKYDLTAVATFITAENINGLLLDNGFKGEIGLLHIDIDGNDYWVWKAINVVQPILVIVEYNSVFGDQNPWTTPYNPSFIRTKAHFSNLYFGSSITSLCDLAEEKGYSFIGCNSNGNNAYFVRKDRLRQLQVKTVKEGYVLSKFSEGRNMNGELTFLRNDARLLAIKGMEIYNTRKNSIEII